MDRDGAILGGRYHLGAKIGTGGMADVYAAVDELLGREVAVKMMRPDLARDENFLERFRREAQNAAKLNHPAIVAVYDTGQTPPEDGSVPYIVMERVQGETLRDIVQEYGKMRLTDAAAIMSQVLEALHFSHEAGIIHRDIKPANIMITNTGAVKVMDFGIARALSDSSSAMTQTAAVIGTAQYLSPEQARGKSADSRSDIYAAGCVFYELATGQPPFSGESPFSVAFQHVQDAPPAPSTIEDMHLSHREADSLDAIVLTAMAKNPDDRHADAKEMALDLRRLSEDQVPLVAKLPGAAGPAGAAGSQDSGGGRHRADESSGAGTAAAAGLGAAGLGAAGAAGAASATQRTAEHSLGGQNFAKNGEYASEQAGGSYGGGAAGAYPAVAGAGAAGAEPPPSFPDHGNYPDTQTPLIDEEPKRRWWIPVVAILAVLALLGAGTWAYVASDRSAATAETVNVPDVKNLTQDEAERKLHDLGLELRVKERPHADIERGRVIRTEPGPNSSVPKGTEISLVVSSGKEITEVPDLTGKNTSEAAQLLKEAGLSLNNRVKEEPSDSVPEGQITEQSPAQGSQVSKGTKVTITVSTGPQEVRVPVVTGQDVEDARSNLESSGFTVIVNKVDSTEPEGKVLSVSDEGSHLREGSEVTLTVSRGNQFHMPNVSGKEFGQVYETLRAAGWEGSPDKLRRVDVPTNDLGRVDRVARQKPSEGATLDKNATVTVDVFIFRLIP